MISIIIPMFNEEKSIGRVLSNLQKLKLNFKSEIIVVDDGSKDRSRNIVKKFSKVRLICHPANKGYGASLKTGVKNSKYEFVLFIDADNQHYANDILRLSRDIGKFDMIVGARTNITSLIRAPYKKVLNFVASYLAERRIPDLNSGFRLVRKSLMEKYFHLLPDTFSLTTTITLAAIKGGYSVKYIPIKMKIRKTGQSVIHPIKDSLRFMILILRITMLFSPLRVYLPISIFLFSTGFLIVIYELITTFNVGDISVLFILSSMLMFFFGLIADQIGFIRRERI
jgi:glycosyltransferase involved in cell wall biosynthesis